MLHVNQYKELSQSIGYVYSIVLYSRTTMVRMTTLLMISDDEPTLQRKK